MANEEGKVCPKCGHDEHHTVKRFAGICIGCPCDYTGEPIDSSPVPEGPANTKGSHETMVVPAGREIPNTLHSSRASMHEGGIADRLVSNRVAAVEETKRGVPTKREVVEINRWLDEQSDPFGILREMRRVGNVPQLLWIYKQSLALSATEKEN